MTTRFVFVHLPGAHEAVPAGRLRIQSDPRTGGFVSSDFLYGGLYVRRADAIAIDPVSLPLPERGERPVLQRPANGLPMFGAVRDAAPDMWGRRVIENRLHRPGPLPEWMYLDHAGADRAGALEVRAHVDGAQAEHTLPLQVDLPYLLQAAEAIEAGEQVPATLAHLFEGGPTMGGMRPKAVIRHEGESFIAKFPSRNDRFDVPAIEQATLRLAGEAGLRVPQTRVQRLPDGRSIMLIKRFDRMPSTGGQTRIHMVSALTMLAVDEMQSTQMAYSDIADVIGHRGVVDQVQADRSELFGRMVFNILVHNNDDHLRNHAFLHAGDAGWRLSPLYDVVPTPSGSHERYLNLAIGAQGRSARLDNALSAAGQFGLRQVEAAGIIDRIHRVVRQWRMTFEREGISTAECDKVASAFLDARLLGLEEALEPLRGRE